MAYRRWTEDEEGYLERFVSDVEERSSTLREVSDYLDIPIEKVRSKLHWLRTEKGHKGLHVRKRYSAEEEEFILDNYAHMKTVYIAERMGRSVESIRDKAKYIGIKKVKSIANHDEKVRSMASGGYFRGEIADALGVNRKSLDTYIRLNKIPCENVPKKIKTEEFRKWW